MQQNLLKSIEKCLKWLEKEMLTFNRGSWGIYERIRIDQNERVCLSRPDTASEYLVAVDGYKKLTGKNIYDDVYENVFNWLSFAQNNREDINGSFCFAFIDGNKTYSCDQSLYQNDNGKILINLLGLYEANGDKKYYDMAKSLADFWVSIQREDGCFHSDDIKILQIFPKAPCFVLWMMAAMYHAYEVFKEEKYLIAGQKAFSYIKTCIVDGRLLTSFEIEGTENWRPVSSENVIAIYAFAHAYRYFKDEELLLSAKTIKEYVRKIIDKETGAVKNCDEKNVNASQNSDLNDCDLVYTESFALNAFVEAYEVFDDIEYLDWAKKLALWLSKVQCSGENPLWDGGWRGSYNLIKKDWSGRCNQNNLKDEGGMYSVYTGWTALPIVMGMIKLIKNI